jgi:hypothetical protein
MISCSKLSHLSVPVIPRIDLLPAFRANRQVLTGPLAALAARDRADFGRR